MRPKGHTSPRTKRGASTAKVLTRVDRSSTYNDGGIMKFYACIDNVYGCISSVWTENEYLSSQEMANFSWEEIESPSLADACAQLRAEGRY